MGGGSSNSAMSKKMEDLLCMWTDGERETGTDVSAIDVTPREFLKRPMSHYMNTALGYTDQIDTWQAKTGEKWGNPFIDPNTDKVFEPNSPQAALDSMALAIQAYTAEIAKIDDDDEAFCRYIRITTACFNPDTYFNRPPTSLTYAPSQIEASWKDIDVTSLKDMTTFFTDTLDPLLEEQIKISVEGFAEQQAEIVVTNAIPRFSAGLRDINAVHSSAFVIGKAAIETAFERDVAKYGADIRIAALTRQNELRLSLTADLAKSAVEIVAQNTLERNRLVANALTQAEEIELRRNTLTVSLLKDIAESTRNYTLGVAEQLKSVMHYTLEAARIGQILNDETNSERLSIRENAFMWDFKVYQAGANLIAAMSGGTMMNPQKPSKMASAVGGAFSGAAVGAQVGGGYGAAIGAGIGALGGLLGSS